MPGSIDKNTSFFEHRYWNTYYYSNIITNILSRDIELIGFISNFFSSENVIPELAKPFQKYSAFHQFIHYMIAEFLENDMNSYDEKMYAHYKAGSKVVPQLYIEWVLNEFDLNDFSFKEFIGPENEILYSDIEAYEEELLLTGRLEELYEKITREVFYVMFNNRQALLQFNYIVAEHMPIDPAEIEEDEERKLFNSKGFIKRANIPEWCKHAVFFRDRGRCCLCTKDLSGLLNLRSARHYDHIVPLGQGGLNDISNIQLLCNDCNNKKSHHTIETSIKYESWY